MSNSPTASPTAAAHPIQIVTRRTGLGADVIRVWEKRYGVVAPVRTASGRRLYSDADVERLRLLLDALAPERVVSRAPRIPVPVERHRTPRGCVLQAAAAAVSVTWFPDAATDIAFGELQVTAWQGVVSRPGSARREREGATATSETTLVPVAAPPDGWKWRATDGMVYDTDALVARCAALLEAQVAAGGR